MKPLLFCITIALIAGSTAYGQGSPETDRSTIYQLYIGEFDASVDMQQFEELRKLGFLRSFSLTNETEFALANKNSPNPAKRIYLGPYLGQLAAEAAMAKAWDLGFKNTQLEMDTTSLKRGKQQDLMYTLQLGAFDRPDMRNFAVIENLPAHGIYLTFEEGFFKVFCGMYRPDEVSYVKKKMIPYLRDRGFYGFVRTFRQPTGLRDAD